MSCCGQILQVRVFRVYEAQQLLQVRDEIAHGPAQWLRGQGGFLLRLGGPLGPLKTHATFGCMFEQAIGQHATLYRLIRGWSRSIRHGAAFGSLKYGKLVEEHLQISDVKPRAQVFHGVSHH